MSLSSEKAALKTAMIALRAVEDEDYEDAIDDVLDAWETWISSAQLTIPIGGVVVVGSATTQNNTAPIVVDNSLS